jgi:hypothetical protein
MIIIIIIIITIIIINIIIAIIIIIIIIIITIIVIHHHHHHRPWPVAGMKWWIHSSSDPVPESFWRDITHSHEGEIVIIIITTIIIAIIIIIASDGYDMVVMAVTIITTPVSTLCTWCK